MKGLSPFIATILLIAFTVAVGGIISIFLTGFFKSSVSSVGTQGNILIACSGASPTVDLVKYPLSGTGNVNATFSNPGSLLVTNVSVFVIMPNTSVFTTSAGNLTALASNASTTLVTPSGGVAPAEVRVVGVCVSSQGTQSVSGSCLAGNPCMTGV